MVIILIIVPHSDTHFLDKYSKQAKNPEIIYSANVVRYFGNNVLHKH